MCRRRRPGVFLSDSHFKQQAPFSRCALASEVSPRHGKKALPFISLQRREAGAARRTTGSAPAAEGPKPAARSASTIAFLSRTARDESGGALALRRPPRSCAEGVTLRLGPGRASWNHRVQTGGPSPAPVQPAPGSPITRRTVDAQGRPDMQCMAASPGTAPVPLSKVPSRKVPP